MEARYYRKLDDDKVQCELCPHYCVIELGESGKCLVRENHEGTLIATQWGHIAAMQSDPIEKKPLYHFMPGSQVFSIGGYGCNLSCSFCQNWHLSTEVGFTKQVTPERIVSYAEEDGSKAIAYTYNEPVINLEFYLEVAKMARERGLRNVLVSNGYVNPEPLSELLEYLDAANIDVKSFEDRFYRELCDARLEPVLETVRGMAGRIHLELTCLVIPTQNDRDGVTGELAKWIASECGEEVPLHLSAYHPAYRAESIPPPRLLS
ncbi:MAG: AmmeMemoRadiSam system radical SAM enzyme [Planctomycetota bacterium]|nr:AmmeMemoRadiSam system radical SAM enzyme [Planctomycetota bacterium]